VEEGGRSIVKPYDKVSATGQRGASRKRGAQAPGDCPPDSLFDYSWAQGEGCHGAPSVLGRLGVGGGGRGPMMGWG
jgi:hypothetical protein